MEAHGQRREGRFAVKQKRFNVEQIVVALKQAQAGVPLVELMRSKEGRYHEEDHEEGDEGKGDRQKQSGENVVKSLAKKW